MGDGLMLRRRALLNSVHPAIARGNPATFNTPIAYNVKDLKVAITPVQDLHGQANPYPPGGGKNLLNNTASTTTSNGVTFTVNADGSVSTSGTADGVAVLRIYQTFNVNENIILSGCPSGGSYESGYSLIVANGSGVALGTDTGSGATVLASSISSIAQIQIIVRNGINVTGKTFYPMIRLASNTDATFAPYSNICPISGWDGVNVVGAGKNILDPTVLKDQASWNYAKIKLNPNTDYTVSSDIPNDGVLLLYAFNSAGWVNTSQVYSGKSVTVTTGEDGIINIQHRRTATSKSFADYTVQIEPGSSATALTPYSATTVPVTFPTPPGTVYGGTLDVTTGVLTVDKGIITLNGTQSQQNSKYDGVNNAVARWNLPANAVANSSGTIANAISDTLKPTLVDMVGNFSGWSYNADLAYTFAISAAGDRVGIAVPFEGTNITNATTMNTWLENHPVTVVYELATPQTYSLTPAQLETVKGLNNVWANAKAVYDTVDLGDLTWAYNSEYAFFATTSPLTGAKVGEAGKVSNVSCSRYQAGTISTDKRINIDTTGCVCISDSSYTDADTFAATLDGLILTFELETPTAIWPNAGEVEVKYLTK